MNAISQEVPAISIAATRLSAAAIMEAATMAELVVLGRLFHAAINSRPDYEYSEELAEQRDNEMGILSTFDDDLTALIADRVPKDAAEYGVKATYLFARVRNEDIADDVEEQVLDALERDARTLAGLPHSIAA